MKRRLFPLLFVSLLTLTGCVIPYGIGGDSPAKGDVNLSIYYVNDTHGAFIRQNTESNYYEAGISYISSYLKSKKSSSTLILSGGDMFQGGYESNTTHGDIMIDAMNEIGFDAMTLGNHEFDWGESYLQGFAQKLNCPILSANTFYSTGYENRPEYLKPYQIFTKENVKVGVIGAAQYNMGSSITGTIAENFYFPNPVNYVKQYSDELRTTHKCDIVIASFHDGGFDGDYESESTFKFKDLTYKSSVTDKKYVDAIFLAHDHRRKDGVINGVPYLEAGCNGRYIGNMTLNLVYDKDNREYSVVGYSKANISAYSNCTTSDPKVDALPKKYVDVIGNPDEVLATLSRSYSKNEFTVVAAKSMMWYVNNHLSDFGGHQVFFSSHNVGGIRVNTIPAGPLTMRNLVTYMPFDNEVCIQICNNTNLNYMRNSSYYETYEEDPVFVDGLTYAVTISYIADDATYGPRCQQSYTKYDRYTAKFTLKEYLKAGLVA